MFSMIFDTNWIITTIKRFICTTGYMQYMISGKRFYLYLIIILFGMIMMLIALKRKYQFKFKFENYFIICLILCVLIPIILSIKYSYSVDLFLSFIVLFYRLSTSRKVYYVCFNSNCFIYEYWL